MSTWTCCPHRKRKGESAYVMIYTKDGEFSGKLEIAERVVNYGGLAVTVTMESRIPLAFQDEQHNGKVIVL